MQASAPSGNLGFGCLTFDGVKKAVLLARERPVRGTAVHACLDFGSGEWVPPVPDDAGNPIVHHVWQPSAVPLAHAMGFADVDRLPLRSHGAMAAFIQRLQAPLI